MHAYNLWKEGDGNQLLEFKFFVRDYLGVFWEIMLNQKWKHYFDLTLRPIFDEAGRCLIGSRLLARGGSGYSKTCHPALLLAQHSFI